MLCLGLLSLLAPSVAESRVRLEPSVAPHSAETSSWFVASTPEPSEVMELTAAVRVDDANRRELEKIFFTVSDPDNSEYGKYLSIEEITHVLGVPAARAERAREFFVLHGAIHTEVNPYRDMIAFKMSVRDVENTLNTTILKYAHKDKPHIQILRASSYYSLPESVANDVILVGELLQFPRFKPPHLSKAVGKGDWPNDCDTGSCEGLVTPGVLAKAYNLPTGDGLPSAEGNSMAVAEFQGQYYIESDLTKFSTECHRDCSIAKVIGGDLPIGGVEAELDIEYIKTVATNIPLTFIYNAQYSLLNWANQITGLSDSPLVHSVSYGNDEAQQTSAEYMYTCNTAFMKAGARGLSILFASGDQGVCGREGCGGLFKKASFKPDFPAGSPYITAVGGTNFHTNSIGAEEAWNDGGGGFSNTFGIPGYQSDAVEGYKSSSDADLPPSYLWNSTGRGYPDVSALGGLKAPYCVATSGRWGGVAGTSAASPVVAGVFALLNGARLKANSASMGFLNPFIYKNADAFNDVEYGENNANYQYGFKAIAGWDPATGFGTPNYEKLAKAAMSYV